ncbi:hypothetical protein F960_02648 [Acinetobacter gerneri DSM 14967 = CIP 107464 = MTCC 9824]|uniref:Uncharacterized protein n=1 Tax=Acinetobacter gerneri DSM 14967 = CIP 107464 = MTCC 9824 TaxID=1120926 RepID=N8Y8F0_9GAMM|nr:hypothetical protein F960_02648 [Acinetobacter gerneri DSM 14967 = CIP 107464 = MTCC 9824]
MQFNKPVPLDVNRPPIIVEERSLDKGKGK